MISRVLRARTGGRLSAEERGTLVERVAKLVDQLELIEASSIEPACSVLHRVIRELREHGRVLWRDSGQDAPF
jgi:hypothetical protein